MENIDIIKNITERTNGDIYLGIVGAVRTGKSTFIKKVIENLVSPTICDMKLDTPEIIKQGSRYGIKLKEVAPAIQLVYTKRKRTHLRDCFLLKDM